MIVETLDRVDRDEFAQRTGWEAKPEGLGMPVMHDEQHGLYAIGPATVGGRALSTAVAADPELVDRDGRPFRISSLRGRKVLLVAWASY